MTDSFNDLVIYILIIILIYVLYKKMYKKNQPVAAPIVNKLIKTQQPKLLGINSNTVNDNNIVSNLEHNELQYTNNNMPYNSISNSDYLNAVISSQPSNDCQNIVASRQPIQEESIDTELLKEPTNFYYTKKFNNDFDYYNPEKLYPAFE